MTDNKDSLENADLKRSHFQPKAYRLHVMYAFAFDAVATIYGKEKTKLIFSLLEAGKQLNVEQIKGLPDYSKNILAERMLDNLRSKNQPISELKHIFKEERILKLNHIIADKYNKIDNTRPIKPLRIMPAYQQFVKEYSGSGRLGETLELAIVLFIVECSEFEYDLIETVFKGLINKIEV